MRSHNQILNGIKTRILPPDRHTVGAAARAADGTEVSSTDPRACRWCLLGATRAEIDQEPPRGGDCIELALVIRERLADAAAELWPDLPHRLLPSLSDRGVPERGLTGHQAVHLILDRAIENCPE